MKTNNILYICLALTLLCLSSCIDEYEADIKDTDIDILVVEGTIKSGLSRFVLSRSVPLNDDSKASNNDYLSSIKESYAGPSYGYNSANKTKVKGAQVSIICSDGTIFQGSEEAPGEYYIITDSLNENLQYCVKISYGGDKYESSFTTPLRTPDIDSLNFVITGEKNNKGITIQTSTTPSSNSKRSYFKWLVAEYWEIITPEYSPYTFSKSTEKIISLPYEIAQKRHHGYGSNMRGPAIYGHNKDFNNGTIINQPLYYLYNNDHKISHLYCAEVTQIAISQGEYEFNNLVKKQTSNMGGLFTPLPAELPSNIKCITNPSKRAIGYVGASLNTAMRRLFINSHEAEYVPFQKPVFETTDLSTYIPFNNGMNVLGYNNREITWVSEWAIDCTSRYWGTIDPDAKPYFWP